MNDIFKKKNHLSCIIQEQDTIISSNIAFFVMLIQYFRTISRTIKKNLHIAVELYDQETNVEITTSKRL